MHTAWLKYIEKINNFWSFGLSEDVRFCELRASWATLHCHRIHNEVNTPVEGQEGGLDADHHHTKKSKGSHKQVSRILVIETIQTNFFPVLKSNPASKVPRTVGIDRLLWKEDDPGPSSACQQRNTN